MVGVSFSRGWILAAVVWVTACGGGGSGGAAGDTAASLNGTAAGKVALSGTITFDLVPNVHGALDYAAVSARPVRGAVVQVLDNAGAVLASGTTDERGGYAVSVPSNTVISVRIKAQMLHTGDAPNWDVSVRDNTASDALYAMDSPSFSSGTAALLARDLHAPSGWDGTQYGTQRVAAPFALLDTIYTNMTKVLSVAPTASFPALRVYWSANNAPSAGNPSLGQIGTTSFEDSAAAGRAIHVLGKADVDTDEYDASVISHEWGHYYQSAFSRDDSPGGSHGSGDLLDRRLAFSEGWGNAWSGIALERSTYTDAGGMGQAGRFELDLTTGPLIHAGWFQEMSIQSIFWNLNRQVGFLPIHRTLSGPFKSGLAVTSIHPFAAAFAAAAPDSESVMSGLLAGQAISASPVDPFGVLETNDGGVPDALPMYGLPALPACVTGEAGSGNKLGRFAYLKFHIANAGNHQITVTGPPASNPDIDIYNAGRIAVGIQDGPTESLTVNLPAGESILAIQDAASPSSRSCFNVSIN
jgi:hypothetical protein